MDPATQELTVIAQRTTNNNVGSKLRADGTNSTGFSALLAGEYEGNLPFFGDVYSGHGVQALFWTSTETSGTRALMRYMDTAASGVARQERPKAERGYSVRCIKD